MGDRDALFTFMDGLVGWAKIELKRRGVQNLTQAMAMAESLIEFRRDGDTHASRRRDFKESKDESSDSGGDNEKHHGRVREGSPKSSERRWDNQEEQKMKYYFCDGPHWMRDCPKTSKLAALVKEIEENEEEQEARISSLRVLNAINAKVVEPSKGPMYSEQGLLVVLLGPS